MLLLRAPRCASWVLVAAWAVVAVDGDRDWATGAWSTSFFKPQKLHVKGVGLVNEGTAYFATDSGISALHEGRVLTPIIEVREPEGASITAFHVCHHRNSIMYELLAPEGGLLAIYEYSLAVKQRVLVREYQDASAPATALACVDQLLLRSSPDRLAAISLQGAWEQVLRTFEVWPEGSDSFSSLAVGFAADVYERARVYAVAAHNRTLLRLHISGSSGPLQLSTEVVVGAGDGADGPLGAATADEPLLVAWARGAVLFSDGCALRQVDDRGHVRTLVGLPEQCVESGSEGGEEERVEPVPWASRLSRLQALAAPAEATTGGPVALLLTASEVVAVDVRPSACSGVPSGACADTSGCGWAEGPNGDVACLDCSGLERWAAAARPEPLEACSLQEGARSDTRYDLGGCGCVAPSTSEPPRPDDNEEGLTAGQAFLVLLLLVAVVVIAGCLYRSSRRAAVMRELYREDAAEFHVFTDDDSLH